MGSPETCTHVILMPESHKLALVFMDIYVHFYPGMHNLI